MATKSNINKKTVVIEKMKKTLGNITASCEAAQIVRTTYYDWYEKDADFCAAIDSIAESCIDFAESSLLQQIKAGNPTSTDIRNMTKEAMEKMLLAMHEGRSVWRISRDNVMEYVPPTQKPITLAGRGITNSSAPYAVVLDLFGGSGSTMMACEQLDRRCYTMEFDPHYCDVIIARWERLTGKQAIKI